MKLWLPTYLNALSNLRWMAGISVELKICPFTLRTFWRAILVSLAACAGAMGWLYPIKLTNAAIRNNTFFINFLFILFCSRYEMRWIFVSFSGDLLSLSREILTIPAPLQPRVRPALPTSQLSPQ